MFLLTISYLLPVAALLFMFWILLTGDIRKQADARYFRAFLLNLIIWLGFLWAADEINSPNSLVYLKLALFAGSFAPLAFFIFCQKFAHYFHRLITGLFATTSALFAFLSLADMLVVSVGRGQLGVAITQSTTLYTLQTLYTLIAFTVSFLWLRRRAIRSKDQRTINQVRFITYGAIVALLVGVAGGSIDASGTNLLSPLAITIFAASSFLAIFRHGLFDIRLVVARSIAYILSLGLITAAFSLLIFGFSGAVIESHFPRSVQQLFYVAVTLSLVLVYYPLKRFFDHFTNRIFYRDAYDPQQLLDELNAALLTTIEIDTMLKLASGIIRKHLRAEFCSFAIRQHQTNEFKLLGLNSLKIESAELNLIHRLVSGPRKKVILSTDVDDETVRLKELLHHNSIMVVAKLATRTENIGFLLLGDKKSGNLYSSQDARVIEIVSDELAIATQNALRFEEIQQFNITLQKKVEEATKQLRHANTHLKELDATKDEFISMASHQLRTPLTSIKGYLSMVLEGDAGKVPKKEKEMIQTAFDSAERMVYLIADLLNVSRLQSGKFVIENKPTDIAKIVSATVNQLEETAKNHHLTLTYQEPVKFPMLNIDETKIQQVVMNFMDNAIYYTPAGGSIEVALEATDSEIRYTVTDTGLGVPKAEQHHLFNKFYRAGNARKMRPDGTGLGLFMAKKVIVAQGGAIIFKSTEGKGSTFGFSFPRGKVELKGGAAAKPAEPAAAKA